MASVTDRWPARGLLAIGALLMAALCYQVITGPTVFLEQLTLDSKGLRLYRDRPFTGTAVSYHDNGALRSAQQFREGRRHGYLREWFEEGQLAFDASFARGERHGLMKSWWRNGNPRSSSFYLHNQLDGESLHWYRTGEKFKRLYYRQGKPEGLQQGWRQNGKLFSNYEYRNGRLYGLNKANLCVELNNEDIAQFTQLN
ncbi:toxin-antitoxin system YwqK family antitoxin [Simiduia agarivorans]|uniref:MORN repeat-containing protein n=1 Tax=Simiduia agarivorans (strain DSM 21679 / JCM 13881 / BCRC 17597 / SA1) TaxID=1117647 RepID=K4KJU3_SIMAS|nr:toxin-antitoxin system YwqK family antitoxin [Simiduia agarivorans]AFU99256.1 MORN repeat-containing protein [Simiduia agarivorans SA1 = DSM 21679]